MTLTKEEQIQAIYDLKVGYTLGHADIAILKSMARQLLASMDQEPIAWLNDAYLGRGVVDGEAGREDAGPGYIPVYREPLFTAPPAPVVPDAMKPVLKDGEIIAYERRGERFSAVAGAAWNTCRAAMLQGADRPQNEPQNIPENIPGGLLEAVNNLLNNDGSRGRYSAMECGAARERIELWLAQHQKWESQRTANLSTGNSPAIPDDVRRMDWLVSKTVDVREPMVYGSHSLFWSQTITDEEDDYHATKLREQIDAAMAAENAAAPQQEV